MTGLVTLESLAGIQPKTSSEARILMIYSGTLDLGSVGSEAFLIHYLVEEVGSAQADPLNHLQAEI